MARFYQLHPPFRSLGNLGAGGRMCFPCRSAGALFGVRILSAGVPLRFTTCLFSAVPLGLGNLVEVMG